MALYLVSVIYPEILNSRVLFPTLLMVSRFGNSVQSTSVNAIVPLSSEVKLKGFSMVRIGNNTGWRIGPAIDGFLLSSFSSYLLFTMGLAISSVFLMLSLFLKEPEIRLFEPTAIHMENRVIIFLSITALLVFIVLSREVIRLSNYAHLIRSLPYDQLRITYLTNGLAVVVTQPMLFRLSRRIGNFISYSAGTLLYSASFFSNGLIIAYPTLSFLRLF